MHLNSEVALDLIEERAAQPETEFWKRHFETCAECSAELDEWTGLRALLGRKHLESAPEGSLRMAEGIFRQPAPAGRGMSIRETIASLVFDSFAQPALAGARGAGAGRQMILRAEGFDIHVKVWGTAASRKMAGQILARQEGQLVDGARLHLLCDGERYETVSADQFGEFEFAELPEGSLSLQIDLPNLTVVGTLNSEASQ